MAITAWESVGSGVQESQLGAVDGVVVNGATDGGSGSYEPPTTGRIFPGPRVIEA
jgi:hypothetical protein